MDRKERDRQGREAYTETDKQQRDRYKERDRDGGRHR